MHPDLSKTENRILTFIAQGQSTKEIAASHGISPRTVAVHKHNIRTKLKFKTDIELYKAWLSHQPSAVK